MLRLLGSLALLLATAAAPAAAETELSRLLPEPIRSAGVLHVVASSSGNPPMLFMGDDARTPQGLEIDLTNALGEVLGIKVEYTTGTFDTLIPAIAAKRADFAVGSIGDLRSRQAQVDFIDYAKAGIAMAVPKGNPLGITDLGSLCGHSVAVTRGSFQEKELAEQKGRCEAKGSTLDVQTFSQSNTAMLALRSERADAWSGDSAPVGYAIAQSGGRMELAGNKVRPIALLGYAVGKDNPQLAKALKAGLEMLVANGTYRKIFAKWGQDATVIETISINDAWL